MKAEDLSTPGVQGPKKSGLKKKKSKPLKIKSMKKVEIASKT